jgi:hypothetical protein
MQAPGSRVQENAPRVVGALVEMMSYVQVSKNLAGAGSQGIERGDAPALPVTCMCLVRPGPALYCQSSKPLPS